MAKPVSETSKKAGNFQKNADDCRNDIKSSDYRGANNHKSRQPQESTMKLYGFPPSPNTWKVRAVAAHVGVPLELALVDLSKRQQRTPEYLALNPTGRTPTLVDGDLVLWESTAIMH